MLMEISLLHAAFFDRDLLGHQLAQAVDYRALHDVLGGGGIDHLAADIGADPHLVDLHLIGGADTDFGDFGEISEMAEVERDTQRVTLRQRALAPTGLLRHHLDHGLHAGGVERHGERTFIRSRPLHLVK